MSWKTILETTEGGNYATPAQNLVRRIDGQIKALETFLADTEELAATDPSLAAMRNDIKAAYEGNLETLDYIGQQDLEAIGDFHAVGALANVSTGLHLIIDTTAPTEGWGPVADFYRAAAVPESDEAKAIEDPAQREAFIAEKRQGWAEGRIQETIVFNQASNLFVEGALEQRKADIDPSYTPDPTKDLSQIPSLGEEGRKMLLINVYDPENGMAKDPIDYEALVLYRNLEAMHYSDATQNAGALLSHEMQMHLQETNMNMVARALNGEYGDKIRISGFRNETYDLESIQPRHAMGMMVTQSGVSFNPVRPPYGAIGVQGIEPNFRLPESEYVMDFLSEDSKANRDQHPQYLEDLGKLVEQSNGERIPAGEIFQALGKDASGPDYSLPPARTYGQIQRDIENLEARVSMLEELVANPQGKNFQDVMKENGIVGATSLETLLIGLKSDIGKNTYDSGIDANTYQEMYDAGNFQSRFEAVLGVPLDQSKNMQLATSPLLQALNKNFSTFYPADANAADIAPVRDGSSQLGEALGARNGVILLDNHTQAEPMQFLLDSLPEIASRGSTKVLLENTITLTTRQNDIGMIFVNQNDPLENYYETDDTAHLDSLKNGYALRLERIAEVRELTPEEQSELDEMHLRDELERQLIADAYTQYGIKFEFYGSGIEGKLADEFGMDTRLLTTNYGWDQQIREAAKGVDNVIVLGGGAHFLNNIPRIGDRGNMVLDESLGYPTFSVANPDGLIRDQADYNLSPTESGRWVPNGDPLAIQPDKPALETRQDPVAAPMAPTQP